MPRNIPAGLVTLLTNNLLTLAYCVKITRRDGTILGFTTHDVQLVVSGVTYYPTESVTNTALRTTDDTGVDDFEIIGILSNSRITDDDIKAGKYDGAELLFFIVNFNNIADGIMTLLRGYFGDITVTDGTYQAEVRGLTSMLKQNIGSVNTPTCRVKRLGNAQCKFNTAGNTVDGHAARVTKSVTVVTDSLNITFGAESASTGYFDYGVVEFTSGPNSGVAREVKQHVLNAGTAEIKLRTPFPFTVSPGDTAILETGCDRRLPTCRDKFANVINFHGEPWLPGTDQIVRMGRPPR